MADSHHGEDGPTSLYRHHHCHFPISRAEPPKDQKALGYLRVPVFSDDESQEKRHLHGVAKTQGQTLLSAWAVLLHKYTGSELVSFAAFYSPEPSDGHERTDTASWKDDGSGVENGSDGCDGVILRYRVFENARLRDVCQVSREPWTQADLARGGSVNTAVDFLGRVSLGQHDGKEGKEELSSLRLKTRHRDVNDCVGNFQLHQSVLSVCPYKDETPFNVDEIHTIQSSSSVYV